MTASVLGRPWLDAGPDIEPGTIRSRCVTSLWDLISDAELVDRVRLGDSEAFDRLMDRHIDSAHAIALALLSNAADAEDACQEAFLTALEKLEQCRDTTRFRPWLMQIVANRARNLRRSRRLRTGVDLDSVMPLPADSSPSREAERAQLRARILVALDAVTELQRQVVLLFDMEGWNHRDIAESLRISEGASRAALFKGRSTLRRLLRNEK